MLEGISSKRETNQVKNMFTASHIFLPSINEGPHWPYCYSELAFWAVRTCCCTEMSSFFSLCIFFNLSIFHTHAWIYQRRKVYRGEENQEDANLLQLFIIILHKSQFDLLSERYGWKPDFVARFCKITVMICQNMEIPFFWWPSMEMQFAKCTQHIELLIL